MKPVPFDAFGLAQAASYCADVADFALPAGGLQLPETAWHAILKTARDAGVLDKKVGDLTALCFS